MPEEMEKHFLEAYEKHADGIYRYCFFRVYNKELAEDITQETFTKTWTYMVEGKEIKNIKAFLYRVAVNLIIDNSRKKKSLSLEGLNISGSNLPTKDQEGVIRHSSIGDAEDKIFNKFEAQEIVKILDKLDDHYKEVIIMRHINDLMPFEIADILNQSSNAVSVRLNHGLKKLRQIIDKKYSNEK